MRFLYVYTAFACAQGITAGKGAVSSLFERADFFKMYGNYMQVPPCPRRFFKTAFRRILMS